MKPSPDTYHRARHCILTSILPGIDSFETRGSRWNEGTVVPGDLVVLFCAPDSPWYCSWVIEADFIKDQWLLRSIEDHSLGRWTNVDMFVVKRERVKPWWKWTDRQWDFKDRWMRVSKRDYQVRLNYPDFDGLKVTLSTRGVFGLNRNATSERTFDDWRKVTIKQMREFFQFAKAESEKPITPL